MLFDILLLFARSLDVRDLQQNMGLPPGLAIDHLYPSCSIGSLDTSYLDVPWHPLCIEPYHFDRKWPSNIMPSMSDKYLYFPSRGGMSQPERGRE